MHASSSTRGLAALTFALALSQFFRSCMAVMAPELQQDLQLSPAGFGTLSSCFFIAFGVAQVPVGIAFDRFGVGAPTRWLMAIGVAASLLLVLAPNGRVAMLAQIGLGLACAPVFMGLMHYAAERLPPQRYATFINRANAIGMLGALAATAPLGWAVHAVGWRGALAAPALCMAIACLGVWRGVRDQGHADAQHERPGAMLQSSLSLLAQPALWTLIPICIAMAAGTTFRNAWGGPYLAEVFGLGPGPRGLALAAISLGAFGAAMALPRLTRRFGSMRGTVLRWTGLCVGAGAALALWPNAGLASNVILLALLGTVGVLHPLVMSHGRHLLAPRVRGRGLGLLNTFVFMGSGLAASAFGLIADAGQRAAIAPVHSFAWIFACAAALLVAGWLAYAASPHVVGDAPKS